MISILQGTIEARSADMLVVMTDGGIGFAVTVPTSFAASAGQTGERVRLYTHMHVREDAVQLFGFASTQQREMFLRLISISGVGPKVAMALLSALSTQQLLAAAAANDVKSVTQAQGVGKKIAERILLELRGQMDSFVAGTQEVAAIPAAQTAQADAVQGLIALGYTAQEAMTAIAQADDGASDTQALIMRALRALDCK